MIRYPLAYNPIIEYWNDIESGKEIVSKKIYRVYKKLVADLHDTKSEWEYSPKRANHALEFIENFCKHSKGKMGGKPFILEMWQKALIAATFGFVHKIDSTRKYQEVVLIVARKNGKSTLASAIGLYLMVADNEPGAEIFAVATKKDQAKIIWLEAKRMVNKSPTLKKRIKSLVSELNSDFNDSFFKPLGSDSETQDGLNVHGALMDEIHAWTDQNLYDVIVDGITAREQPLIFVTSTAGTVRENVYDQKYEQCERVINGYDDPDGEQNERLLPIIYELDSRDEWKDETCWKKANPGLGTIKKDSFLIQKVKNAKANSKLVKNLLTKDFNIRDSSSEAWLSFEDINNRLEYDMEELRGCYAVGGVDLSSTSDLTCATLVIFKDNVKYIIQKYFIPEETMELKIKDDKVPYDIWIQRGYVYACPGNVVDYKDVTAWFVEMVREWDIRPLWIGYDRHMATYWIDDMKNFGFELEKVAQGAITMSTPMKILEADLKGKRVNYNNNQCLKWNLTNTVIKTDDNDGIRPVKGKNQKARIDGTVSLINAYVVLDLHMQDYQAMA